HRYLRDRDAAGHGHSGGTSIRRQAFAGLPAYSDRRLVVGDWTHSRAGGGSLVDDPAAAIHRGQSAGSGLAGSLSRSPALGHPAAIVLYGFAALFASHEYRQAGVFRGG